MTPQADSNAAKATAAEPTTDTPAAGAVARADAADVAAAAQQAGSGISRFWLAHRRRILGVSSALFIACFALDAGLATTPLWVRASLRSLVIITWILFAFDFLIDVAHAKHKLHYIAHHPVRLLAAVLPAFHVLQLFAVVPVAATSALQFRKRLSYVTTVGAGIVIAAVFSAIMVRIAERNAPGATITTFADALWWAVSTITTVGYGDVTPVTAAGRIIATILMAASFVLLAAGAGIASNWLAHRLGAPASSAPPHPTTGHSPSAQAPQAEAQAHTGEHAGEHEAELARLRAENALLKELVTRGMGADALDTIRGTTHHDTTS
ncbi:potassium channel family protein [Corynebacterium sp. 13CS0277]|uniref:potassium channel family protein n=1 Tax=Corynebacterium sp. 13CS0277 TaxID=2071994 RepID=UPI001304915B|nr:potassium channel family protein [Corynebacterium sp. 13CS0277]